MYNQPYELYGRKVVLMPFHAAGDGRNPSLARADARKVAEDMHAFASIGGPTQTAAYPTSWPAGGDLHGLRATAPPTT